MLVMNQDNSHVTVIDIVDHSLGINNYILNEFPRAVNFICKLNSGSYYEGANIIVSEFGTLLSISPLI